MRNLFFPSSRPIFLDSNEVIAGLSRIASKLSQKNKNVSAVYLFGSYARGDAGLRSDADILVVLRHDARKMRDRLEEFILEFADAPVAVDVLVYTVEELEKALREKNPFLTRAASGLKL